MNRILIVEDEVNMQIGLRDNLEFEGYEVEVAGDGAEGVEKARVNDYDLILLDIMLPKLSGYDVCKSIRKSGVETPVIFLSAKGEEFDKVLGLELGADDYVTKPFSIRELLARVKAVIRRGKNGNGNRNSATNRVVIGLLELDFDAFQARRNQEEVHLTHKEFEILRYLHDRANQTVSRDELLQEIWGYHTQITTRTVDNFIAKIRQKAEHTPAKPQFILTVHGVGYKLIRA